MSYSKDNSNTDNAYDVADFFSLTAGKYEGSLPLRFTQDAFERFRVYVLGCMVFFCSAVSLIMNFFEGSVIFLYPVLTTCALGAGSLIFLYFKKGYESFISVLLWTTLMLLGFYIIFSDQSSDHRSLLWINMMPPTVILTAGLRKGSILFVFFISMLMMFFFTPLSNLVENPVELGMQLRLLTTMTGCFAVVACVEYARSRTYKALQNAVMHIGQTSLTDPLTGLGNRRYFDKFLEWVMANAQRSGRDYAVALVDIDHFKRINDTFGHDLGDEVLKHLATQLQRHIRIGDLLFRWGGEEFMIVMPHCNSVEAEVAAERIRANIQETPFCFGSEKIYLTLSLGVYSGSEIVDPKVPMSIADQCLYKAKSGGRNKFFINT